MSGTYRDLKSWQAAMDLVVAVYRATDSFPDVERYGLTAQVRRASVSVASNIAEGKGRASDKDLVHFLSTARGSLFEVETQVMLAKRLGCLNERQSADLLAKAAEAGRLLNGLIRSFRTEATGPRQETRSRSLKPEA